MGMWEEGRLTMEHCPCWLLGGVPRHLCLPQGKAATRNQTFNLTSISGVEGDTAMIETKFLISKFTLPRALETGKMMLLLMVSAESRSLVQRGRVMGGSSIYSPPAEKPSHIIFRATEH